MKLLPPRLVLILTVISVVLGLLVPILGPLAIGFRIGGGVVLAIGVGLNLRSAQRFARIGTNIVTFNDPGTLVTDGAFRFTRNPMYLGFVGIMIGVALLVGTLSAWVGVIGFWLAANQWYIPFEEGRMLARFGDDYVAYQRRVRRWLGPPREAGR